MVCRKQKLIAAGSVLTFGLAAAMLFRRDAIAPAASPAAAVSPVGTPVTPASLASKAFDDQSSPAAPTRAINVGLARGNAAAPSNVEILSRPREFDDAASGRPADATIGGLTDPIPATSSPFRIHVVHNGDTLERLAERYLADGARALELFDFNRDVLENPHLLPIGSELRIPTSASAARN